MNSATDVDDLQLVTELLLGTAFKWQFVEIAEN